MKLLYGLIILILLQNCSFDNKTGIWKDDNNISQKEKDIFIDFKNLSISDKSFDEKISIINNFTFNLPQPVVNKVWHDKFYSKNNNQKNFKYNGLNEILLKSKKLSRFSIDNHILFDNRNLILTDAQGNIIIFSIDANKVVKKFNFYKKKYKKLKKTLNIILEDNIIYVSDNIGYLYAYDYLNEKIIWAKYYKIPFRSNLKITKNTIIASDQNNKLIFFDKSNGNTLKTILTEETVVKNDFTNNLSANSNSLYFLNTYGSLYSIDLKTMDINWILNLNPSLDVSASSLFFGSKIVFQENKIISSSNKFTYVIDAESGILVHKKNFSTFFRPIVIKNYLFIITKNDFLIAMNLVNGKIIYSHNINEKISEFLDTKRKKVSIKNFSIINDQIYIFLNNSYIVN